MSAETRLRYATDPEYRARRLESNRAWRQEHRAYYQLSKQMWNQKQSRAEINARYELEERP
jgi:hypothetical protein